MKVSEKKICYRCGKERIVLKVWQEKMGNSVIETTEYVCIDKKCEAAQKKDNKNQINRRVQMEKRKKDLIINRRIAAQNKKNKS